MKLVTCSLPEPLYRYLMNRFFGNDKFKPSTVTLEIEKVNYKLLAKRTPCRPRNSNSAT